MQSSGIRSFWIVVQLLGLFVLSCFWKTYCAVFAVSSLTAGSLLTYASTSAEKREHERRWQSNREA